jgi:hypothetical protein
MSLIGSAKDTIKIIGDIVEPTSNLVTWDLVMIQTIKQIKISEIVEAIQRMGVNQDTLINLTIETIEEDILTVFNRIGKEAQAKGLTEEILEELLADES